jgi:hypothetical protein
MKLPANAVIPIEKLTDYLLVRRLRNDKSGYLARTGYNASNWHILESDIRKLIQTRDAEPAGQNEFGEFLVVRGELLGPNNSPLNVKTVWIQLAETGDTRFVTLVPNEE